ncbi:MAG: hypothetical protein HY564_03165 [Candidatus Jacksonbacteria bacterium]|nr:hypothetical protein [Candidatus Jacksonbacteria bacterium]
MFKKEIIWRELLYQTIEKRFPSSITQKGMADQFKFSLSTVFHALKVPREIGAVSISQKGVQVRDSEKFITLWGTTRRLTKDMLYTTFVPLSINEVERQMPQGIIWGVYSAFRMKYAQGKALPASYDKAYVYADKHIAQEIQKRFPATTNKKSAANLIVLKADPYLASYGGGVTTIAHTLADLWNCKEWYAAEFYKTLLARILP